MAAFNVSVLKPAGKADKPQQNSTARDELLAQIETQLALWAYPKAVGQRLYEVEGDQVAFQLRHGGKALKLLGEDTKVAVAASQFVGALEHYKAEVGKGVLDDQLEENGSASAARRAKAKATRDAKKADKPTD